MIKKNTNFIIIGPSGSGKSTQAEFIKKLYGQKHLVMGDLLREIENQETNLSREIKEKIQKGEWVSDEIVNQVIKDRISKEEKNQGLIIDGYPRTVSQAEYLEKIFANQRRNTPILININISEKSVVFRLLNRKVCDKCGKLYYPPKSLSQTNCDKCDGRLVRREDDTEKIIKKRLSEFSKKAKNVIDYYRNNGKVIDINGESEISEVSKEIKEKLEKYDQRNSN